MLLAVSDNAGHGLFATVERVINQVLYARAKGLEPFVYVGELVFAEGTSCEHGPQPYFDPAQGDNLWEYFFEQPGVRGLRLADLGGARGGGARGGSGALVRSVQVVPPELLYAPSGGTGNFTQTYPMDYTYNTYNEPLRRRFRAAAHAVLGDRAALVRPALRRRARAEWRRWRRVSSRILGVHVRGTDKTVAPRVPPEAYFPFVDAWLARAPDALVFVATDQASYLHRFEARYGRAAVVGGAGGAGRVLSSLAARRTDQFIHASSGGRDGGDGGGEGDSGGGAQGVGSGGFARGRAALHDALLLSECDFLLKSASAIPEFALWVRPALHERHVDLQLEDRFRSQQLPAWAAHLAADGGAAFCAALARGCALDAAADAAAAAAAANRTRLASASASAASSSSSSAAAAALNQPHRCARCLPPVDGRNAAAAAATRAVPAGARCDGGSGPRLLTLAECMAFARLPPHAHAYKFIGTQVERSEFPGCILWKGKYVEFNDHRLQRRGCNVHAQQGECLCTSAP